MSGMNEKDVEMDSLVTVKWYNAVGMWMFLASLAGFAILLAVIVLNVIGVVSVSSDVVPLAGLTLSALFIVGVGMGGA